jgi:hypothetical protein
VQEPGSESRNYLGGRHLADHDVDMAEADAAAACAMHHTVNVRCNVRNRRTTPAFLAVALALVASGCGGGPTAPSKPTQGAVTIDPTPTPAPVPTPTPTPEPAGQIARYTATVYVMQWYDDPVFTSPTFEVVRFADHIEFGTVSLPILAQDDRTLIARTTQMRFSIVDNGWSFDGVPGTGSGTLSKR